MLEWRRLQCARVTRSCQTETVDDGKWVTLQRMTVGGEWNGERKEHTSVKGCVKGTGCWGGII